MSSTLEGTTRGPDPASPNATPTSVGAQWSEAKSPAPLPDAPLPITAAFQLSVWTGTALYVTLLLVIAFSPFEAGYPPIGRFFNATFTNLEVILLALAAIWTLKMLVDPAARQRLLRLPLLWPVLALLSASIISTLFGEYKSLGVQFTYRLVMGAVVLASVWETLRTTRRLLVALCTLVGAALISAVLGLLEFAPWFDIDGALLMAFKPMPTTVGGALRLSGSFEYANGAAMYFEMVLPIVLGLTVLFSSRRLLEGIADLGLLLRNPQSAIRNLLRVAAFVLFGVFSMALLLTLSRAALAGVGIALLMFAGAAFVRGRSAESANIANVKPILLKSLALAGLTMLLAVAYIYTTQPIFRLRLTTENDRNWYNVAYQPGTVPPLSAGDWVTVPLTLRNDGPMVWQAQGVLPIHVSYHWLSEDRKTALVFEGVRTPLPRNVNPGESIMVDASVVAPSRPGVYYLQWDLVQERVVWFAYKTGIQSATTRHEVAQASASPNHRKAPVTRMPAPVSAYIAPDADTVERSKLWKSALKMFLAHPITGVGPDGFRNLRGQYEGVTSWNKNIFTNNTYIEMFTNLGILGGLAFLWLSGLALWSAMRAILRGPVDAGWAIGLGTGASLAAFFFHGFLDYFLFSTPLYVIFWLLLGVGTLQGWKVGKLEGLSVPTFQLSNFPTFQRRKRC